MPCASAGVNAEEEEVHEPNTQVVVTMAALDTVVSSHLLLQSQVSPQVRSTRDLSKRHWLSYIKVVHQISLCTHCCHITPLGPTF